jgi:predicted MFS family arabinose efflux permease
MVTALDSASIRRRYLLLSATRWLPTGLLLPLITIAPTERGISLAEIGALTAVGGTVVLLLELPTGGLADVWGRRPVLLAATAFSLCSTALLAFADSFLVYAAAWSIEGVYRALDSGPLDAWYVDSALDSDPDADIETSLSKRGLVLSASIGAGALTTGMLALLPQPEGLPFLALPILVALALRAVDGVALATLLVEQPTPAHLAGGRSRARTALRDTGKTLRTSARLLRASSALLALALAEALWGAGMGAAEIFAAPRLVDLLGDPGGGVTVFAIASMVGWSVSGLGSSAAPWIARNTGGWVNAAVITRVVQGAAILIPGLFGGPVALLGGYLGFYLVHGAANVAHYGLLNRNVGPEQRTTMISVNSLTSRLGGVIAGPILGVLATSAGLPVVFGVSAALLAAGGPLYLWARPDPTGAGRSSSETGTRVLAQPDLDRGRGSTFEHSLEPPGELPIGCDRLDDGRGLARENREGARIEL